MDAQNLFNIATAIAGFLGGWVLNNLRDSITSLQKSDHELADKVQKIEVLVAGQYVTRNDFNSLTTALFTKLDKIESKLDTKVDR
jgi:hypothetical protein